MRKLIDAGKDPIAERDRDQQAASITAVALTFEKAARKVYEELKPGWRNAKHADDWIRSLEAYVFPLLGQKKLDAVTAADCADVLRPIWLGKAETVSRTRHACTPSCNGPGRTAISRRTRLQWSITFSLPKQNAKKEHQPRDAVARRARLRENACCQIQAGRSHPRRPAFPDIDGGAQRRSARRGVG
ncbi:phage integrase central domain-containing protein [Paraburkholderia sp. WSM4175]|uniref:phage integrase central domain-containing protein n=1 Tax=Paraburkholderia sp. WSM4175 TaxID=2991072 RepID=UPI003D2453D2